jgi:hypothetical protein
MKKLAPREVLPLVHGILRSRYGEIDIISGQGIAKGQRVEFDDNGQRVRCVIKTSSGGRISFGRREDGTWSGLSESDRVVVVAPVELDGDDQMVSMFDQKVLKNGFEANHDAQQKAGMGHIPNWIAPFHEEGRGFRGTGDGFADKAMWSEPLSHGPTAAPAVPLNRKLTLQQAKEGLALTFGVSPDAVEITIKG